MKVLKTFLNFSSQCHVKQSKENPLTETHGERMIILCSCSECTVYNVSLRLVRKYITDLEGSTYICSTCFSSIKMQIYKQNISFLNSPTINPTFSFTHTSLLLYETLLANKLLWCLESIRSNIPLFKTSWDNSGRGKVCSHETRHENEVSNWALLFSIRNEEGLSLSGCVFIARLCPCRPDRSFTAVSVWRCYVEPRNFKRLVHREYSSVLPTVTRVWETILISRNTRDMGYGSWEGKRRTITEHSGVRLHSGFKKKTTAQHF